MFIVACGVIHYHDKEFDITKYITPILTIIGIFIAIQTISKTKQTEKEKNAIEFEKIMSSEDMRRDLLSINILRKSMLQSDKKTLDRRKMSSYMEEISGLTKNDKDSLLSDEEVEKLRDDAHNAEGRRNRAQAAEKLRVDGITRAKINNWKAIANTLNAMEVCANAIRYNIYDEELIYNIYGSQIIKIYEMCYTFIKRRQSTEERLFMNFEWLAVKWTLQRNISGEVSKRMKETLTTISHANEELKRHLKAEDVSKLKPYLDKLEKLRAPD